MIHPRGNPQSPVWVITDEPFSKDYAHGTIYSSGLGYIFDKAWKDAGINAAPFIGFLTDPHNPIKCPIEIDFKVYLDVLELYKPPIICTVGEKVTALFCPETSRRKKGVATDESSLEKWAGSLLTSQYVSFPHYCIPILSPDKLAANYEYRFVYVNVDLGRVRDELNHFLLHGVLQSLPEYLILTDPTYDELISILYDFYKAPILGCDIETIRPPKGSKLFGKHPGYTYLLALADRPDRGVSFCLWNYTTDQTIKLFQVLDDLLDNVPQVGQNYFTFDSHYIKALGFRMCLSKCQDTMLRHQILWPELPHKLQFLTKHYTRQPYYKDEGKFGSPRNLKPWMHYNAMDAIITRNVYFAQEEEFNDRPYLR
jgi:hypothetical protein